MGAGERAADPRAPKPVDRLTVKALRTSALAEQRPRGRLCAERTGHVDEDGFLHLSDRAHDMVISGDANIYPVEIEACLLELDGVRDVAVFGTPTKSSARRSPPISTPIGRPR